MKKSIISFISLSWMINYAIAQDVQYSVVAFPNPTQKVNVQVNGQWYPLQANANVPQLYQGSAPFSATYQYGLISDDQQNNAIEAYQRNLTQGTQSTGNEFFNRSRTVYDVPELPMAYHPIYPPLLSKFNQSNEVATLIFNCDATTFNAILTNPKGEHNYTRCDDFYYISHDTSLKFIQAGIKNSGKSTKEFSKQSFKVKLNEFTPKGESEQLFYGRTTLKLRAHETDITFMREKLLLDLLGASGAATLQGSYVRLYVNNEPLGLYLMIDDAATSTISNMLHQGDPNVKIGPTYKGNAMTPQEEGNLKFLGDDPALYTDTIYEVEDKGRDYEPKLTKENEKQPLIQFIRQLSTIKPEEATSAENKGSLSTLLDEKHTLIHTCYSFLTGSWDGFVYQASNYYLNHDFTRNQWVLISYDFDETLGVGAPPHFINTTWQNYTRPDSQRPLVDALLKSPYWASEYETMLKTIVKRVFKPSVIEPRLEAWRQMIREDVEFDLSLPRTTPGIQTNWTFWNFDHNIKETDGQNFGIAEWVRIRTAALQQQLNFNDVDDLPPLGPYTGGKQWNQETDGVKPAKDKKEKSSATSLSVNGIMLFISTLFIVFFAS
ncbi:coth protein-domain-containing protein [Cunninghamella echinulata]|nr:coth protein-domain-containing protein [Cunninghamella echinulata]